MTGARKFFLPPSTAAWLLSLLLVLVTLRLPEPPHRLEYQRITNQRGIPLWVVVYSPEPGRDVNEPFNAASGKPGVVLIQPFNNPPEYGRLLALELVRDGFVVLVFDWRGRATEENRQLIRAGAQEVLRADVAAAVGYVRRLRDVDPARVLVAGHSVGGTLAIEAGLTDPTIAGVISIGMEGDATPAGPPNLLWATGLYDEFRVLNRMREFFQASAGTVAMENTTVGDFTKGTARRLGVSPTADHFTEFQDQGIHREVREWARRVAGLPPGPGRLWMETRALLWLVAWLVALVAALGTLRQAAAGRRWVLRATATVALLAVALLGRASGPRFLLVTDVVLWLLLFTLWAGFVCTREAEALSRGWRFALRLGLVAWASVFLTLMVNNIANYVHEPRYLLFLPEFALRHALDGLYAYLMVWSRPLLFSIYNPEVVCPRWWIYAVMAAEVIYPGLLLGLVARMARRRREAPTDRRPLPKVSVAILIVLLAALGAVAWLRLQQGFLTGESAWAALRFLLRFTVLPLFIFGLLWRWLGKKPAAPF